MEDTTASTLENEIISKHPEQFHRGEIWLGIDIGDGWKTIVLDACRQVQVTLTADELHPFHWTQIKQKWGQLRMYWRPRSGVAICCTAPDGIIEFERVTQREISTGNGGNEISVATQERIRAIVDLAAERASVTCEICGEDGQLRHVGCVRVLCDACLRSRLHSVSTN
ncbi:MAG: hypothetical protein WC073_03940 [Sterolibacterium sp.]